MSDGAIPPGPLSGDDGKLLVKLLDTLKPFAEVAEKLKHCPVVEICEPTPNNPSRNIIPMPREWFERAGDDLQAIAIQLHAAGVLSEGQASKLTGLDRVEIRREVDRLAPNAPVEASGSVREKLAATIKRHLLDVAPDDQDVVLEDDDWRLILAALCPQPSGETLAADAGREALRKVIHELWQLLDDGETGADGTVTIDQSRYQEVSKAMDELEALVPDSAGPFWGGFPVNYFWGIRPVPSAETAGEAPLLKTDEGGCVTKRFVIFTQPGRAPEKKGGWLQDKYLIEFLREVMLHYGWTPGFRATVLELTWDNDLWASSASEYLSIHDHAIGRRRARKAWQVAREKHERIYKATPYMPLGQEITAYHRRTAPAVSGADKLRIAVEALERISGQPLYYERDTADGPRRRCPSCAHAWSVATPEHHAPGCTRIIASEGLAALKSTPQGGAEHG